jgi:hypothetical protein
MVDYSQCVRAYAATLTMPAGCAFERLLPGDRFVSAVSSERPLHSDQMPAAGLTIDLCVRILRDGLSD